MLRRTLKLTILLAALLAGGAAALWVCVDHAASGPWLKPRIEEAASSFLGRPLTIDALEWRRWPSATLVGRNVRLYEDPLKTRLLVDAPVVEARVALLSIFKLAAGITELRFLSPRVCLRRDKDGVWNAARVVDEIAARPDGPVSRWGSVAFNWFVIESGTVTIEDEAGRLGALSPLEIRGSGKLRFGKRHVHFPFELSGRLADSPASFQFGGDVGGHVKLRAEVKNGEASLARLAWPPAARWDGRWGGTLFYDERAAPAWRMSLRAAGLAISTSAPRIDSLELSGAYASAASAALSARARSSTTSVDVNASLKDGALDLDVKSPKADLNDLWAFVRAFSAMTPAGPPRTVSPAAAWPVTATISGQDIRYGETDFRDAHAVIRRSTGPYILESLSIQSLGGEIEANGSYRPGAKDDALEFSWKASSVSIQDLFRLAGSTFQAGGVVDTEGSLETGLGRRMLAALTGNVKFDIKNGWFENVPGLLKVLSRLNIVSLIAEARGRRRARVNFRETRGTVGIVKGRIATGEPLVLENKTLQLAFMGTYDLPTRTVDGRLVVNFLTVTDEIIRLIPGVRDILLGKEKGLIPIWVKVSGNAADPRVEILSARTIAAPVWNTLGHILRLPKTLFEKLKPPAR